MTWPAFAYLYGTWPYALARAADLAKDRRRKVYLYRADFLGTPRWVASWDPKP